MEESVISLGDSHAKEVITKSVDYTLLIVNLLLQYLRCETPSVQEIVDAYHNNAYYNETDAIYSCALEELTTDNLLTPEIVTAVTLTLTYGFVAIIFVWVHSKRRFKTVRQAPPAGVEKIYKWTEKFIIIDSILEIPISFYFAPIMTIFLWAAYACFIFGLLIAGLNYSEKVDSKTAEVFWMSALMVALALLKLTGEMSQYWVIYKAVSSEDAKEKLEEVQTKSALELMKLSLTDLAKSMSKD